MYNNNEEQLFLSSKIGDGHCYISKQNINARITYMSVNKEYLQFKKSIIDSSDFTCSEIRVKDNSKGYNKQGIIYTLNVFTNPKLNGISNLSKLEVIKNLNYFGFLIYYLDDGSFHKCRKTMHIYCNSFSAEEVSALQDKVYELFPYKRCTVHIDKKVDGRAYPYLYVPRVTVEAIIRQYREFMLNNKFLHSMLYKLGLPSQTIESQQKC